MEFIMNNSELKIFNYEKTNVRTSIKNGSVPLHRDIMKKRYTSIRKGLM